MVRTARLENACCHIHKRKSMTGKYHNTASHCGGTLPGPPGVLLFGFMKKQLPPWPGLFYRLKPQMVHNSAPVSSSPNLAPSGKSASRLSSVAISFTPQTFRRKDPELYPFAV